MRDVEELKEKASEILANAAEAAEAVADKAIEVGVPVAQKTLDATKSKLDDLEAHGEAALTNLEKHSKAKSSHGGRKALGWSLAAAGAGGIAYLLWRRSRPVEDPWAEEYWVDLRDEDVDADAELDEALVEAIEEALAEEAVEEAAEEEAEEEEKKPET